MNLSIEIRSFLFFENLLCLGGYFILLAYIYDSQISEAWQYMGFINYFSFNKFILCILVIISASFFLEAKLEVKNIFYIIMTYLYVIPSLILFTFGAISYDAILIVLSALTVFYIFSNIPINQIYGLYVSREVICTMMLFITIMIVSLVFFYGDRKFNFNFLNVYQYRSDAALNLPHIFNYLISPLSKVVIPIGIVLSMYLRNVLYTIIFLILTIVLFGLTHHKTIIFIPLAALAIYIMLIKFATLRFFSFVFIFIVLIGYFDYLASIMFPNNIYLGHFSSFIIRRILFLPPLITSIYIEFFSLDTFIYWANSNITIGIFEKIDAAPLLVGENFFGDNVWANTGFVGSGYANAGVLGVLIYSILLGSITNLLNNLGNSHGHIFVSSISIPIFITLALSTDTITALLTHGLLILIIILNFTQPTHNER